MKDAKKREHPKQIWLVNKKKKSTENFQISNQISNDAEKYETLL